MMNTSGIFRIVREQAKKITGSGNTSNQTQKTGYQPQVIDSHAVEKPASDLKFDDLQQLFRHQFPSVTRQLLGRRYNTVNKVSKFILPNGMEQASDELLELLADFASQLASTESVLSATGSREVNQLRADLGRSQRAGFALKEVNKAIAAVQGALSGATGLVGAAIDLPASVIFSLKTIYEIGHSYGFELDDEEDQKAVYFALSKIDLGLIAEKQALFLALRSLKAIFATGDMSQISSFLNSNYSVDQFKSYLTDDAGQYKWAALQGLNKLRVLRFAIPVVGGAVGAVYNVRLIEEIATQADDVFAKARHYLNQNSDAELTILDAYYKQIDVLAQQDKLLASASPLLDVKTDRSEKDDEAEQQLLAEQALQNLEKNEDISDVKVLKKEQVLDTSDVEQKISEGLAKLADENVVEVTESAVSAKKSNEQHEEKEIQKDEIKAVPKPEHSSDTATQINADEVEELGEEDAKKTTAKRAKTPKTTPPKKS